MEMCNILVILKFPCALMIHVADVYLSFLFIKNISNYKATLFNNKYIDQSVMYKI